MAASIKNFDLIIKGFKSKTQIKEFIKWYEGQGEQDASLWLEDVKAQGIIGVDSMNRDHSKPCIETPDNISMWIDPR